MPARSGPAGDPKGAEQCGGEGESGVSEHGSDRSPEPTQPDESPFRPGARELNTLREITENRGEKLFLKAAQLEIAHGLSIEGSSASGLLLIQFPIVHCLGDALHSGILLRKGNEEVQAGPRGPQTHRHCAQVSGTLLGLGGHRLEILVLRNRRPQHAPLPVTRGASRAPRALPGAGSG